MRTYITSPLDGKQCDDFISWFDTVIGTEIDIDETVNKDGSTLFIITCHELEANEVSKCRYFENNKLRKV